MKNILKLASQTIDGLRALPAIGRIVARNGEVQALAQSLSAAEIRAAMALDELTEAKARIATLVESDGKLRLENERLMEEVDRLKAGLDAVQEIVE